MQKTADKTLMILLKEPFKEHTATSLAKNLEITRQGLWKTLNRLSKENLISLKSIADIKKSAVKIDIQYKNPISIKELSLLLTKESMNYERWIDNFKSLDSHVEFLVLFGSILHSPKEANDIDILAVTKKNSFKHIDNIVLDIQRAQEKKVHLIDLTKEELKIELKKSNKAYIDALKKGIVLFGQDNFIKFISDLK